MQTHPQKFAPTLALKLYSQDLIGRAKLFDISEASQHRGLFLARALPVWRARTRRVLQRAVCHLAARIDNNACYYMASSASGQDEPNRAL